MYMHIAELPCRIFIKHFIRQAKLATVEVKLTGYDVCVSGTFRCISRGRGKRERKWLWQEPARVTEGSQAPLEDRQRGAMQLSRENIPGAETGLCEGVITRGSGVSEEQPIGHLYTFIFREGNGNPLQCSCLENPRDGGAWWATVYGVAQSQTWLKQLSSNRSIPSFVKCLLKSFAHLLISYFWVLRAFYMSWV